MLTVFFGNDTIAVRTKAFAHMASLEQKGFEVIRIEAESYEKGMCTGIVGGISLFGGKKVYVFDTPSTDDGFYEELMELLPSLSESSDAYVVVEGTLLAAEKKKYERCGGELKESTAGSKESFNVFSLADALARKDKKVLWVGLAQAFQNGLSSEEIIGTLWWQLKSLRLAAQTKSASEAGMKDFLYNKAKRALSAFKEGELERLSADLLAVYNDGHSGVRDIDTALESWVLSIR